MSFDAYGRSVISRGPTALRNEEMVRVGNLPYSTSRITETTMKNNPAYYGETGRHSQVTRSRISSSGGPRRPVKKYNTSLMNLDASKSINRTGTGSSNSLLAGHRYVVPDSPVVRPVYPVTNVEQEHRVSSGRYDSGLGLNEPLKIIKNKKPVKHIPGVVSRCCGSDDDDDDLETDHVSGTVKTTSPSIQSLSTPLTKGSTYLNSYSTSIPTMERQDSAFEQMDIQSPTLPVGGTSFDPTQYQKHLDDIQRRATEWSRLQEGLAMLLPNTDGDT